MIENNKNSNLTKRVIVAIIAVPLIVLIVIAGGNYFTGFLLLIQLIILYEFYDMFKSKNFFPLKLFSLLFSIIIFLSIFTTKISPVPTITIFFVFVFAIEIFRGEKRSPLNPFISFSGILYITVPIILFNMIRTSGEQNTGMYRILMIFVLIWVCDIFAYFGGKLFGRNKLSDISPNKTIEGSFAGLIFTLIFGIIIHFIFPMKISFMDAAISALIIGLFGQVGDLFESSIKRYCEVKDSSDIIPGHGGFFDRFDSLLFTSPLLYIYFFYIKNFI